MIRELNSLEKSNQEFIEKYTTNSVLLILTETGFEKSIMDATYPVRFFFESNSLHNYQTQQLGPDHKIMISAKYYLGNKLYDTGISLYRPETKDGDPRLWFTGLKKNKLLTGACAFCIVYNSGNLFIFNLSISNFISSLSKDILLRDLLDSFRKVEDSVAVELLQKISRIYLQGWVKSVGIGDKAVGETLENLLGIPTNSSQKPDYKGIELKSSRKRPRRQTRSNLFAQVADWTKSEIKNSDGMLSRFGYFRNGKTRLNCTVSTSVENSQGLRFYIDEKHEELIEAFVKGSKIEKVLVWPFKLLMDRLQEKHNETFWVIADAKKDENGNEEFLYHTIIHTRKPFLHKLVPLISSGVITMDHLISKSATKGTSERGPLFKINKNNLDQLFPEVNVIDLRDYNFADT